MQTGNPVPITFPLGGINEDAAYASEPGRVAVRADHVLNLRPHDSLERRKRGGQRTGISKYFADQVNGSNAIQNINATVEAVALSEDAGFGSKFANPATLPGNTVETLAFHPDGDFLVLTNNEGGGDDRIRSYAYNSLTGWGAAVQSILRTTGSGTPRRVQFNADGTYLLTFSDSASRGGVYATVSKSTGLADLVNFPSAVGIGASNVWRDAFFHPDGDWVFIVYEDSATSRGAVRAYSFDGSSFTLEHTFVSAATSDYVAGSIAPDGSFLVLTGINTTATVEHSKASGFSNNLTITTGMGNTCNMHPDGTHVVGQFGTAGRVIPVNATTGPGTAIDVTLPTSPSNATPNQPNWSPDGQYVAFGLQSSPFVEVRPWTGAFGAKIDDPPTLPANDVGTFEWSPDGTSIVLGGIGSPFVNAYPWTNASVNPSARRRRIVAVSAGTVKRSNSDLDTLTTVNSGAAALISSGVVRSTEAFQKMFFVDSTASGQKFLDYADNTMKDWESNLSAGSLPVGTDDNTIGTRFITLYRRRVVLGGLLEEPQNWFMSAAGDPLDFDYSPTVTNATQAVAGNNSNAGELGDVLTSLMPFQDDLLFMGGANSLWVMRGDPAAGGQIDNISRQIGVTGPDAWCWDSRSTLYFMGQNGLYRMTPGSVVPELISQNRLDNIFNAIDMSAVDIRLSYDREWQGVHIFITPTSEPGSPTDQYFWDERTDSFWRDQYPTTIGPTSVYFFEADDPEKRALLIGGWGGHIRSFDDAAANDDGVAIDSFVRFPLLHPSLPMGQFQMSDLQMTLDGNGDGVEFDIFRGKTPEEAALANATVFTKTLVGGRNVPIRKRLRANALNFRIRNNTVGETWAYEQGIVLLTGVGRQRARL